MVIGGEQVPWANCKIGPGAPPVKTEAGWLTLFHAVTKYPDQEFSAWHPGWNKCYTIGLMLLDLNEPWKVLGMYEEPLMAPEADYELEGFRGEVLFPGGMILEDDGEVKIYYGAADTVECLATARIEDLVSLCNQNG
jgi:beta-1,4-mannooligosaccharide/beta-1,4-mannosyl-N-acetylglucosamine phosphorylase